MIFVIAESILKDEAATAEFIRIAKANLATVRAEKENHEQTEEKAGDKSGSSVGKTSAEQKRNGKNADRHRQQEFPPGFPFDLLYLFQPAFQIVKA